MYCAASGAIIMNYELCLQNYKTISELLELFL